MNSWQMLDILHTFPYCDRIYVVIVTSSIDLADHEKAKTYKQVIGYFEKPINAEMIVTLKENSLLKGLI
jgi:hypothetical protein